MSVAAIASDALLKLVGGQVVHELSKYGLAGIHPSLSASGAGSAAAVPFSYAPEKLKSNQFEANVAWDFEMLRRAGKVAKVERQVNLDLRVYGKHVCFYKPDFRITWADGSQEIVEVKGAWAKESWLKWKLFETIWSHEHAEVKLTVIRQK